MRIPSELAPTLYPLTDRIVSARVQQFQGEVHRFRYGLLGRSDQLELAGSPPRFAPGSGFGPLKLRAMVLGGAAVVALVVVLVVGISYGARHTWYAYYGEGGTVGWLLFASFVLAMVAAAGMSLPRRTWSPVTAWGPLIATVAALVAAFTVHIGSGPTKREGELALSSGNTARALTVAKALVALGIDPDGGRDLEDQLHYRELVQAGSLERKRDLATQVWHGEIYAAKAREHIVEEAQKDGERFTNDCNIERLDRIAETVRPVDDSYANQLSSRAALCRVSQCAASADCDCVERSLAAATHVAKGARDGARKMAQAAFHEGFVSSASKAKEASDVTLREGLLRKSVELAECSTRLGGTVEGRELDKLKKDQQAALVLVRAKEEQQARAERLRQQQEEARQQQEAALAAAREASRRVTCCDGTLSPSCLCNRPNYRGCCSHHGGVCGCE